MPPTMSPAARIIAANSPLLSTAPSHTNPPLSLSHFHASEPFTARILHLIASHNSDDATALHSAFESVFGYLSEAIKHAKSTPHLPELLHWRAFLIKEYIKSNKAALSDALGDNAELLQGGAFRAYWMRILLDCDMGLKVLKVQENASSSLPHLPEMLLKLRGEACLRLGSLEKAKEDLLACVAKMQEGVQSIMQQGKEPEEPYFDMEAAHLLQETVDRLTEKTNAELRRLQERMGELRMRERGIEEQESSDVSNAEEKGADERVSAIPQNSAPQEIIAQSQPCEVRAIAPTQFTPPGRLQHACTRTSFTVYFHGGYNNTNEELSDFFAFDLHSNEWRVLDRGMYEEERVENGEVPAPRYAHSLVQLGHGESSQFAIYGGRTENGASGELWIYDTNSWELCSEHTPLFGHLCVPLLDGTLAFLFGQSGRELFSEVVHTFSSINKSWHEHHAPEDAEFPPQRAFAAGCMWGADKYVLFGGMEAYTGRALNDIWICENLRSGSECASSWRQIKPEGGAPPVYNHAIALHEDRLYVCGQYDDPHLYVLDLAEEKWTKYALRESAAGNLQQREGYSCVVNTNDCKAELCVFYGQAEDNSYPQECMCIELPRR